MGFVEMLKSENNIGYTENGGVAYNTTGHALLDMNYFVSSFRHMTADDILDYWIKSYTENRDYALRWLFYCRDVRGGLGERRTFQIIMFWLAQRDPNLVIAFIESSTIPFFGYWIDLISLLDMSLIKGCAFEKHEVGSEIPESVKHAIMKALLHQLTNDQLAMAEGHPVSLLAKWMPSVNAGTTSKKLAQQIAKAFGWREKTYRQNLSKLRKYLDVVEVKMSANKWSEIKYEGVPSKANLLYRNSFFRHDADRRKAFIAAVNSGKSKMNSNLVFPHEIIRDIRNGDIVSENDEYRTLEAMWKSMVDNAKDMNNTLVIRDGSGSMERFINHSSLTTALDVADALAIYFAERMQGEFHDTFITFSARPQIVSFQNCHSLLDKIQLLKGYDDYMNTDLKAVFELVLKTAIANNLKQEELPESLLIISDGEFDTMCDSAEKHDFDEINQMFAEAGYQVPRLIFWNVNNRSMTIPVKENNRGVALISGFSTNAIKMAMTGQLDPFQALLDIIMDHRYDCVVAAYADK